MNNLGLTNMVVVFDQAVYCKFQEIRLGTEVWEKHLVPRMGEFHNLYLSFQSSENASVMLDLPTY